MAQDVPQALDDLAQLARDRVGDLHTYRMAMVHLIFGLRAHVNHMTGALSEIGPTGLREMELSLSALREDIGILLARMDGPQLDLVADQPKAGRLA